jgi:hypothetical protein
LPSRAGGMALSWIGVKVVKFAVASLCCKPEERRNSVKLAIRISFFWRDLSSHT